MASHPSFNDNTSNNESFADVLERGLASPRRRRLIQGGLGLSALASAPVCAPAVAAAASVQAGSPTLGFAPTAMSMADSVSVPEGYTVAVLHATGDPLTKADRPYSNAGLDDPESFGRRVGDHHDGMHLFYLSDQGRFSAKAARRAVLVVNHESSADAQFFHPKGQTSGGMSGKKFSQFGGKEGWDGGARPGSEVVKEILHHGVSIAEVRFDAAGVPVGYLQGSALNRRITPETPVVVRGPAAHRADIHRLFSTRHDPTGNTARGTINNCGYGYTPWGTYLACEENWAQYFNIPAGGRSADAKLTESRRRYGVARSPMPEVLPAGYTTQSQGWFMVADAPDRGQRFARWNISAHGNSAAEDFRQEPHTFGYNLEIDPADPRSVPAKRVAMGRFAHEAAVVGIPAAGQPLSFYMGCDGRSEYIYKFVTAAPWDPADVGRGMAAGNKYLDEGRLYVAKFNDDGSGEWLELSIDNPRIREFSKNGFAFENQAEVYVHTRLAADAVGATKMDRPEWGAVNPANGEVYFALTNNNQANRSPQQVNAANPRSYVDDGKPDSGNPNGHIIRFREDSVRASAFRWDIFLFGAEEGSPAGSNLSGLTAANAFSSPDGLWFSPTTGICWIQTDDGAYKDETNCMLLAAIPGQVGDGGPIEVKNTNAAGDAVLSTQSSFLGATLGEARLRRFLVAPRGAEVTGLAETADGRAVLVNIQHPGENSRPLQGARDFSPEGLESTWPANGGGLARSYGAGVRPRSATLVISRKDGKRIGEA